MNSQNIHIIILFALLLFVQGNFTLTVTTKDVYYLDSNSLCQINCGSLEEPFSNFIEAITSIKTYSTDATLLVREGQYFGENNKEISIDFNLIIISTEGSYRTIIDCENAGYGFYFFGTSSITLKGFTIKNCVSGLGGAIQTENFRTDLEDILFLYNNAREGSAIYSTSNTLNIQSSQFIKNIGGSYALVIKDSFGFIKFTKFLSNSNDLFCSNAEIISLDSSFGSKCNICEITNEHLINECGLKKSSAECNHDGVCNQIIENHSNCPSYCPNDSMFCDNDSKCELPFENLENCPNDCNLERLPGWKLESTNQLIEKPSSESFNTQFNNLLSVKYLESPEISEFMSNYYSPVTGRLSSFVLPSKATTSSSSSTNSNYFILKLKAKNLAVIMFLNNIVIFDAYFTQQQQEEEINFEKEIYLSRKDANFIQIQFTSVNENQRDLSLFWKEVSHSNGHNNVDQEFQLIPSFYRSDSAPAQPTCGDGICNEQPETCFIDCYDQFQKQCTLNSENKKLLPGIEYMYYGYALESGKPSPHPLFEMTSCQEFMPIKLENRNDTFFYPSELSVEIHSKCSMDTSTRVYPNQDEWGNESLKVNDLIEYPFLLEAAKKIHKKKSFTAMKFPKSLSDELAGDTENGPLYQVSIDCQYYKVQKEGTLRFSHEFLKDVAEAIASDVNEEKIAKAMKSVVAKYGIFYYKTAKMGGRLDQFFTTSQNFINTQTKSQLKRARDTSFYSKISHKVDSNSNFISFSSSIDSLTSVADQALFEQNTKKSNLQINGGKPGSFGIEDPNSFSSWANSMDLFQVPIDSTFGLISNLFPDWNFNQYDPKRMWDLGTAYYFKELYGPDHSAFYNNELDMYFPSVVFHSSVTVGQTSVSYEGDDTIYLLKKSGGSLMSSFTSKKIPFYIWTTPGIIYPTISYLYNIFDSRVYKYQFMQGQKNFYKFIDQNDGLVFYFKSPVFTPQSASESTNIQVTVVGTLNSVSFAFTEYYLEYTIASRDLNLGRILGVQIQLVPSIPTGVPATSFSFDGLVIHQACTSIECASLGSNVMYGYIAKPNILYPYSIQDSKPSHSWVSVRKYSI